MFPVPSTPTTASGTESSSASPAPLACESGYTEGSDIEMPRGPVWCTVGVCAIGTSVYRSASANDDDRTPGRLCAAPVVVEPVLDQPAGDRQARREQHALALARVPRQDLLL